MTTATDIRHISMGHDDPVKYYQLFATTPNGDEQSYVGVYTTSEERARELCAWHLKAINAFGLEIQQEPVEVLDIHAGNNVRLDSPSTLSHSYRQGAPRRYTREQIHALRLEHGLPVSEGPDDLTVYDNHGHVYRIDDLQTIFDKAADPDDWKGPISVWCEGEAVFPLIAAIEFYTATVPRVNLNTDTMRYLVESEGYRDGPAGP